MKLNDLIERLTELRDEVEGDVDVEVRIATQPNYPMQSTIGAFAIVFPDETGSDDDGPANNAERREASKTIVYIGEGSQVYDAPYLPGVAAEALGWR